MYHLGNIPVRLQRKDVRHLRLRINPKGEFYLSIPRDAHLHTAHVFLEEQREWVKTQHRRRARLASAPDYRDGEEIAWWGETLRLEVHEVDPVKADVQSVLHDEPVMGARQDIDDIRVDLLRSAFGLPPLRRTGGTRGTGGSRGASQKRWMKAEVRGQVLHIEIPRGTDRETRHELVEGLRKQQMEARLDELLPKWTARFGIEELGRVRIRRMKTRWGSCNPRTRALTFNLELSARDPKYLEYVVAHELTHYFHSNHGPEFHALLSEHLPNERALRRELNTRKP